MKKKKTAAMKAPAPPPPMAPRFCSLAAIALQDVISVKGRATPVLVPALYALDMLGRVWTFDTVSKTWAKVSREAVKSPATPAPAPVDVLVRCGACTDKVRLIVSSPKVDDDGRLLLPPCTCCGAVQHRPGEGWAGGLLRSSVYS
jgi:hypothetical protein